MKSNHCICRRLLVMVVTVAVCVTMFGNISKVHAASTYQIKINKQQNCVTIYKLDSNGKYKPVKEMLGFFLFHGLPLLHLSVGSHPVEYGSLIAEGFPSGPGLEEL